MPYSKISDMILYSENELFTLFAKKWLQAPKCYS